MELTAVHRLRVDRLARFLARAIVPGGPPSRGLLRDDNTSAQFDSQDVSFAAVHMRHDRRCFVRLAAWRRGRAPLDLSVYLSPGAPAWTRSAFRRTCPSERASVDEALACVEREAAAWVAEGCGAPTALEQLEIVPLPGDAADVGEYALRCLFQSRELYPQVLHV